MSEFNTVVAEGAVINPLIHETTEKLVQLAKDDFAQHVANGKIPPKQEGDMSDASEIMCLLFNSCAVAVNRSYGGQVTIMETFQSMQATLQDLAVVNETETVQ